MRRTKTFRLAIILGLLLASVYLIKLYIKHKVEEMTFELYLEDTEKIELARTEEVRRIEFKSRVTYFSQIGHSMMRSLLLFLFCMAMEKH
jgi:hypothetical protein